MRILACLLLFGTILTAPVQVRTIQFGNPAIVAPRPGSVLQGVVTINGSSDSKGFVSAEVAFTYADDPTGTWFQIATSTRPVFNDILATWDTTVITDGNYVLRLRVMLTDGTFQDAIVSGLRVRNYTPVETPTPVPVAPEATPLPTATPTATPYPTPTALPRNPAELAPTDVSTSILYGGLAVLLAFVLVGIYLWLRKSRF